MGADWVRADDEGEVEALEDPILADFGGRKSPFVT